jgi:hypothetical protein
MNREPGEHCPDCEGSGYGPCATCGDEHSECCCDEPVETECGSCDGTGRNQEE